MTFNVVPRERTTENSDRKYSYCVKPDSNLDLGANFLLPLMMDFNDGVLGCTLWQMHALKRINTV